MLPTTPQYLELADEPSKAVDDASMFGAADEPLDAADDASVFVAYP